MNCLILLEFLTTCRSLFLFLKKLPNLQTPSLMYTLEKLNQSKNLNLKFRNMFQAWILMNLSWTTPSYHVIIQIFILLIKTTDMLIEDLRIIDNSSQKDKIYETRSINVKETWSDLFSRPESYKKIWCSKHVIHKSSIIEWKQNVLTLIDDEILKLSRQSKCNILSVLKD